jgi:hypothetical protein
LFAHFGRFQFIISNNYFVMIDFGRDIDETLTRFGTFYQRISAGDLIPAGEKIDGSYQGPGAHSLASSQASE